MAPTTPIQTVQAAAMKSAAGKAAAAGPVQSTQVGAVRQDLAVMADQAKGYTAKVNAGVINAQDNRAAQARRLAADKAAADAARAAEIQMAQMRQQEAALRGEAAKQDFARQEARARREAAEQSSAPDEENARKVMIAMKSQTSPGFQGAFMDLMSQGVTSASEALAILRNLKEHEPDIYGGVNEDAVRRYASAYFQALEGRAINVASLDRKRKSSSTSSSTPSRSTTSDDDGGGGGGSSLIERFTPFGKGWRFGL